MGNSRSAEEYNQLEQEKNNQAKKIAELEEATLKQSEEIVEFKKQIENLHGELRRKNGEIEALNKKVRGEQAQKGKLQHQFDRVLSKDSWRKIDPEMFSLKYKKALLEKITSMAVQRIGICINICLFGVCNSGKSSFINTCATALQDGERHVELATVGSSSESLTTRLREYKISSKDNKHLISMYDCRGMDDSRGVTTKDLISIVKGHIRSNYEINSEKAISEESDFYRQVPQIEDIMHCVVFVIDAEVPNEKLLSDHCLEQFKEVETVLEAEDIPVLAIVCKTDTLPIGEKNRLQDIFHSKSVEIKCRAVAEKLQIPLKNVLPMSNYFKEPLPTDEKDVLALNCLKEMTLRAADRLKQVYRYNNL